MLWPGLDQIKSLKTDRVIGQTHFSAFCGAPNTHCVLAAPYSPISVKKNKPCRIFTKKGLTQRGLTKEVRGLGEGRQQLL